MDSTSDFFSRLSPEVFSTSVSSARQRELEIPLLGELPKAIEPHLPVCQLYRWQLGPNNLCTISVLHVDANADV